MVDQAKFWDRMAKRYSKQPISDEAAYQQKLDITQSFLKPTDTVLEIGCGTGGTSMKHAPFVDSILATDISAKMLAIAEERRQKAGVNNVTFQKLDVENAEIEAGKYDVVLGMSILHLLDAREKVLKNIWDALKPGGYFISSSVCIGTSLGILRLILPLAKPFGLLPSVQFFSEEELIAEHEAAGFRMEHRFRPNPKAALFLVAKKGD